VSLKLGQLILERRDEIISRFVEASRSEELSPPGLARSLLVDHIPIFLEEVAQDLAGADQPQLNPEGADQSASARKHGEQRWNLGYDLEAVLREYGILRGAILETAKAAGVLPSTDDFNVLGNSLSVGVREATTRYIEYRDQEVEAQKASLSFLAEAGELLSSSLDYRSTLSRLTRLLVPRMADWCVVHLDGGVSEDMPIAHVDASKVDLLREIYRRQTEADAPAEGYPSLTQSAAPRLVAEVDPVLLAASAQDPAHLYLLEQLASCSWLTVPLCVQEHTFGALSLAYSDSGRHYGASDLVLATDLARRAAVAIDNARLYQLSQQERSRVESATRAKDEFVAMVSHELRTPLNAILGWVRLIRGGGLPEQKLWHAFEVIERNANAQNQLVADLLDISRAITGKIRIQPSQVDLSTIIDIAIEDARVAIDAKRLQIHVALDRQQATLRGDGDRLQQVVWNLLTNAIKFTPKGGEIRLSLQRIESDLELVVKDTGAGIAADFVPHVFESFRQSDSSSSRTHGGLGVGLSITKHLVDLHGGSIEVHSEGTGQGTTFVVRLPVSPLLSATLGVSQMPATREHVPSMDLPGALQGLRVLVVDDDADARELIGYVLETCGTEVRLAGTAAAALEQLMTYTPDVIVSDIGMPDEDGYSLIRSIRTLPVAEKKDVPAIALTAFARNEDRTRALVAGFNLHMAKPVEPGALVRAVLELAGPARREP
jgi:signal transduction histidine kinase/ActR/RegA family two-component response regulator